jgi:hypothetical protein
MRDLLLQLPLLTITAELEINYAAADPALLVQLADSAEVTMRSIHLGTAAIGQLLARAAPEIECGEISADVIEGLGWLLAELGDAAAVAHSLGAGCRRHTADYAPRTIKTVPNARP